jgi:hypothetical protein
MDVSPRAYLLLVPTVVGMALAWIGNAILFGVVPVLALTLFLAALLASAFVKGRKLRKARLQAPPSATEARAKAVRALETARRNHLAYLAAVPFLVALFLYEFGWTTGAILTSAGLIVLLIGGIPSHREYMSALRNRIDSNPLQTEPTE